MWRSPSSPQIRQKYIYIWNNSYRTHTECWQKTSDSPQGKKILTYVEKTETKEQGWDLHFWEGAVKEEVSTHQETPSMAETGVWVRGKLRSHGGECSNRGAEGKAERFPHRGLVPTSPHHSERLVCSPPGVGGGWELRLGLRRSDPGRGLWLAV